MPSVSAQYSIVLRVEIDHRPGMLGLVATAIGEAGGSIGSVDLVAIEGGHTLRDITVETAGEEHAARIGEAADQVDGARLVEITDRTFQMHVGGKIEQRNKLPVRTRDDLSMAYTPGVARVCTAIARDRDKAFQYTIKRNTVAVVSDGSAVLGLGDIGPEAAMPVMEGKAVLFKEFGGVDAFPICLSTKDPEQIIQTVINIAPGFGGINLEDISAPRCFEIEERLKAVLDIPVFHDDQHGTAVVTLAALMNAGQAHGQGAQGPQGPDRRPRRGRDRGGQDPAPGRRDATSSAATAAAPSTPTAPTTRTARCRRSSAGSPRPPTPTSATARPADVIDGADLFVGLSGARVMPPEALEKMNRDAMVFAMANPNPEITPEEAQPYARVIATGRSDYPNQINNVLCFPGHLPRRARRHERATSPRR